MFSSEHTNASPFDIGVEAGEASRLYEHTSPSLLPAAILLIALALRTVIFAVTPARFGRGFAFSTALVPRHWPLAISSMVPSYTSWPPSHRPSLIVLGLLGLVAGHVPARAWPRTYGIFLILILVVGPGLIVNAGPHDHWEPSQAADIVEFRRAATTARAAAR